MGVPKKPILKLLRLFGSVSDARVQGRVEYPLREVLMAAFVAVLAGAGTFIDIWEFCNSKKEWLSDNFMIKHGIPSHDTFRRVLSIIDPSVLQSATVAFLIDNIRLLRRAFNIEEPELRQYCVDGKTARGTGRLKGTEREVKQLHTLHVYDRTDGICIFSKQVGDKTNEIPVAQDVLKLLNLQGSVVSFDSLHTQRDTVATVVKQKGAYMLALKGNQHALYEEAKSYFTLGRLMQLESSENNYIEVKSKAHNRIEIRKYYLTKNISWLVQAKDWAGFKSLIYYSSQTEDINTGKKTEEDYIYMSSLTDVVLCADVIRGHWSVENLLHYHLDVNFFEDETMIIDRVAFQNISLMNKMALSITKLIAPLLKKSVRLTKKHIGWNVDTITKSFCFLDEDILEEMLLNVKV